MQKLARAVDGIDEDEGAPAARLLAARGGFLGHDGNEGEAPGKASEDDLFRQFVGVADHALVGLLPGVNLAGIDAHHRDSGLDDEVRENLGHFVAIDAIENAFG